MKFYEYKILKDKVFKKSIITEAELNRLGKQGWELVNVTSAEGFKTAYFKREV